ncbi:unnamed protein product [Chironomus riparius]|uniref:Uncharacterized protein n=1 Tax=Chironomus riparius TaxID=315576 RepID=A0A9N9RVZ4_9DIPT|nr:unnamed protein product [Chironomus riparius]
MINKIVLLLIAIAKISCDIEDEISQLEIPTGTKYSYFSNISEPTSSKNPKELVIYERPAGSPYLFLRNISAPNAIMMKPMESMQMDENGPPDFRSEILIKVLLSIVIYKAIAFTFLMLILLVVLPAINPAYQRKKL